MGKAELQDPTWLKTGPTIAATGSTTTQCVPLTSGLKFFIVREATPPPIQSIRIASISYSVAGVMLGWVADASASFRVEWSPDGRSGSQFADPLTSPTGSFSFLDDGSQTGGLDQMRLYRVVQVP